jgi:hypothetical protein
MARQAVFPDRVRFLDCLNYTILQGKGSVQGVTKRCRPSWLTNSALVYVPKCGGGGGLETVGTHGAKINFGDLTPYLTYGKV